MAIGKSPLHWELRVQYREKVEGNMDVNAAQVSYPEIYNHLSGESTSDVLRAWRENDGEMWVPEAFEVMEGLLTERLGHAPPPRGTPHGDIENALDGGIDEIASPTAGDDDELADDEDDEDEGDDADSDEETYGPILETLSERYVCGVCKSVGAVVESGGPARDYAFASCLQCGHADVYNLAILEQAPELGAAMDLLFGPA